MSGFVLMALAASAFDLTCTAYRVSDNLGRKQQAQFVDVHLRVDLVARRWCDGECLESKPIVKVTDDTIIFADQDYQRAAPFNVYRVNRESGKLEHYYGQAGMFAVSEVTVAPEHACERKPFSGLPELRF